MFMLFFHKKSKYICIENVLFKPHSVKYHNIIRPISFSLQKDPCQVFVQTKVIMSYISYWSKTPLQIALFLDIKYVVTGYDGVESLAVSCSVWIDKTSDFIRTTART